MKKEDKDLAKAMKFIKDLRGDVKPLSYFQIFQGWMISLFFFLVLLTGVVWFGKVLLGLLGWL